MRIRAYGETALLVEVADVGAVLALHASLRTALPAGVTEVVAGARTILLQLAPEADRTAVAADVTGRNPAAPTSGDGKLVDIVVVYDGPDLAEVGQLTGLSEAEVVDAHTGTDVLVAFGGFAPGFAYLSGLPETLHAPRRAEPRTTVPAGSVGLAGAFTGVYPRASPGGWQLIGRAEVQLWDLDRDPPALLQPGDRVRFHRA